jgi:hypothetical protein
MKKYLFAIPVLVLAMTFVHAQGASESGGSAAAAAATAVTPASQMDAAVRALAESLNKKLIEGKAGKITVGQFAYRGNIVPLGTYWVNQLTGELANIPNKPYIILSAGTTGADRTISGEIIDTADNVVRVYTRLIRAEDRAVEASFHFDFERNGQIAALLASGSSQGGRSSSSSVAPDASEPDSFENPLPYEIGADQNAPPANRTLHSGDEDFFLLLPENDGQLTMETTGNTDTYMEFYNAETREKLGQNDDGGSGSNARIRYSVQAGKRYIAKVRGYDGDTGNYGFRAYLAVRTVSGGFENPLAYEIGADENAPVMNRSLDNDDEDFFLLLPANDGQLIMETTGSTDTFMEFYNADTRQKLAEDDDGGRGSNARIRHDVQAGQRYIAKVRGYDGDTGSYGFRAYIQVQVRLTPDEYEPDNDPASAKQIEIGTSQQHTFHNTNDVDWVKFQITQPGRYTIRTRGVNSNRLDTYIELFDSNQNSIDENDDGGDGLDSRLSLHLENGLYYLKVECLDERPNQPYTISVTAE